MVTLKREKIVNSEVKIDNSDDTEMIADHERKDNVEENEEKDRIANFFTDKTIFITGGTGFLGKVLIEKLLRSCSGLKKIYVLIRKKKDKRPEERLKEILNSPLFDLLKKQRDENTFLKQIKAVYGDVILPDLGLSPEDRRKIIEEVEIIYHSAATIRFDEPLRYAVFINTRGTKFMLDLARQCTKLILFIHMSTAYCHCMEEILYEKPYDPPANAEDIINICEKFDDNTIASFEKKILKSYPNSYSYTKALAEDLVVKTFHELPTIILRPSIIVPMLKDPIPGWTDNMNGPTGLLIGAGKGIFRTMYFSGDHLSDLVPVDFVVNFILVASWYNKCVNKMHTRVANITGFNEIGATWNDIINTARWIVENRVPYNTIAWYPGGSPTKSRFWHNLCVILFHWIPAVIGDALLRSAGYPSVLIRVQNRFLKASSMIEYFINREWIFSNSEAIKTKLFMNQRERNAYIVKKEDINLFEYLEACIYFSRRYIFKTPDDMIPAAKRQMKIMWFLDRFCKIILLLWLAYFIYKQILFRFFS